PPPTLFPYTTLFRSDGPGSVFRALELPREPAHRLDADRERGEVTGARGTHVRERTLPERQVLAGRLRPGADARLGAAAPGAGQHALAQAPLDAQRRIAQPGAGDRLPRTVHRELLDPCAQPVEADAGTDLEVDAGGLGDAHAVRGRDLDDIERGVERLEARDAGGERRRHAAGGEARATLVEARELGAGERLGNLRLERAHAGAELADRGVHLERAARGEEPVGGVPEQPAGLE